MRFYLPVWFSRTSNLDPQVRQAADGPPNSPIVLLTSNQLCSIRVPSQCFRGSTWPKFEISLAVPTPSPQSSLQLRWQTLVPKTVRRRCIQNRPEVGLPATLCNPETDLSFAATPPMDRQS